MNYYLGIDPGWDSGACVLLAEDLNSSIIVDIKKDNRDEVRNFLSKYASCIKFAVIEKVSSSPRQGVTSAFNFGRGYERLQTILECFSIPFELVQPQAWMPIINVRAQPKVLTNTMTVKERETVRRQNKEQGKKDTFNYIKNVFPFAPLRSVSKDGNRADAFGIALYCWNHYRPTSQS